MKKTTFSRVFWGIILLLLAVGLLMNKLGSPILGFLPDFSVWQILLGLAFAATLIESLIDFNFGGILFSLAFLGIVFNKQLHIEQLVPWTLLLVALLGTIALDMIFGSKHKRHENHAAFESHGGCCGDNNGEVKQYPVETVEGERIFERIRFGAVSKYVHSDNFNYADLECSFGAMEVYFDKVAVPSGQATIEIHSSFAGVSLYIPKEWKIINRMRSSMGAVDEKGYSSEWTGESNVTVTIIGDNKFGGVEINRV